MSVPMTTNHIKRWDTRGQIFLADIFTYCRVVLPRMIKFMIIHIGHVSRRLAMPPSQGVGPQCSQIFGTPTCDHTVWPRATNFDTVTSEEWRFGGQTHPIPRSGAPVLQIFATFTYTIPRVTKFGTVTHLGKRHMF